MAQAGAGVVVKLNFIQITPMEARLLLATIAQRFRLQLPPGHQVEVNPLATLGCKGTVPMQVTAR